MNKYLRRTEALGTSISLISARQISICGTTERLGSPMNDNTPAPEAANENATAGQPDPVAELTRANAELKDQLLRTLAEMENLRKRTERDVQDARTYGAASFARDVVAVGDNIRRALDATGADWKAKA